MRRSALAAICLVLLALAPAGAHGASVILGILEETSPAQQTRLREAYGQQAAGVIRIAFHGEGGVWRGFSSDINDSQELAAAVGKFPARLAWTVAHDGRALGRLESRSPGRWLAYEDIGLQFIAPQSRIPRIGAPAEIYEQWGGDAPVRRPLVVVSGGSVADPEQWRPASPADSALRRAREDLLPRLKQENPELKVESQDLRLLSAYRSRTGETLLALGLKGAPPEGEVPGPEWGPHWFIVDSARLSFLGNDLLLIDAGDYDGDGRSELVFRRSGYDYEGYALFFDNFRGVATFGWSPH
jgi:hypothetical protein